MPEDNIFQSDVVPDQVRGDAQTALKDVLCWQMTDLKWSEVSGLVAAMERAAAAGDIVAFDIATGELELAAPVRNNHIEQPPRDRRGIDDNLRERVNRLQHTLGETDSAAEKGNSGDDSGGDR